MSVPQARFQRQEKRTFISARGNRVTRLRVLRRSPKLKLTFVVAIHYIAPYDNVSRALIALGHLRINNETARNDHMTQCSHFPNSSPSHSPYLHYRPSRYHPISSGGSYHMSSNELLGASSGVDWMSMRYRVRWGRGESNLRDW